MNWSKGQKFLHNILIWETEKFMQKNDYLKVLQLKLVLQLIEFDGVCLVFCRTVKRKKWEKKTPKSYISDSTDVSYHVNSYAC